MLVAKLLRQKCCDVAGYSASSFCAKFLAQLSPLLALLGAFAKSRKAFSSATSVCPSASIEKVGSHRTNFNKIWYLRIFLKPVQEIQVSLKCDNNGG